MTTPLGGTYLLPRVITVMNSWSLSLFMSCWLDLSIFTTAAMTYELASESLVPWLAAHWHHALNEPWELGSLVSYTLAPCSEWALGISRCGLMYKAVSSIISSQDQIFCARLVASSKIRIWTRSLVKLRHNYMSIWTCCQTNQIGQWVN